MPNLTIFRGRNEPLSLESGYTLISDFTEGTPEACEFCDPPYENEPLSAFDVCHPLGEIALKPALGQLQRPGYMLGITRRHITSFAQLPQEDLEFAGRAFDAFEDYASKKFHDSYLRFEHGSDNVDSCGVGAGACVTHAHQHLLPASKAAERMREALNWQVIDSYTDLSQFRGRPYFYMGYGGEHLVMPEPRLPSGERLPSQWGRRIIAETYGNEVYDWALQNGAGELVLTLKRLGLLPPGFLTLDVSADQLTFTPHRSNPHVHAEIAITPGLIEEGNYPPAVQDLLEEFRMNQPH